MTNYDVAMNILEMCPYLQLIGVVIVLAAWFLIYRWWTVWRFTKK